MATQTSTSAPIIGSFVNGAFLSAGQPSLTSLNPANPSEVVARVVEATTDQANQTVEAASLAQGKWAGLSGPARADHLYRWADQIQARMAEIAEVVAREVGKPIGEAKGEVGRCVAILRYFAGDAVREVGQVIPGLASASLQYSLRTPLGVVGLITPWNFPVAIPLWKAAPALACGNTVVLKPAETSLLSAVLLAETAKAAGLPDGVFNVLLGNGPALGQVILDHPLVRGVSFTGSARVGAIVAERCARRNVKFQTEMGGKNAAIVLPDANLKQAAVLVAGGAMRFAGQKCTATSRVIVHRDVVDAFQAELMTAIESLKVSDPMDPDCAVGPVITDLSQERIEAAISGQWSSCMPRRCPGDRILRGPDPLHGCRSCFEPRARGGLWAGFGDDHGS